MYNCCVAYLAMSRVVVRLHFEMRLPESIGFSFVFVRCPQIMSHTCVSVLPLMQELA